MFDDSLVQKSMLQLVKKKKINKKVNLISLGQSETK